jgi:L-alanine-DL-glutamate epimerase-like enolase superfamily enzyme
MNVMVELHGLWSPSTASSIIRSLEPYAPYWVEDPVRTDVVGALQEVHATAATTGTLIAGGETVTGAAGFLPMLSQPSVDVVTLDLSWCGGITHATRIAALAELHGRAVAPHDCTGPVALTAATHLSVAAPNALVQETVRSTMRTWYQDFVTVLPPVTAGRIRPPEGPGLGTELQPDIRTRNGVRVRVSVT